MSDIAAFGRLLGAGWVLMRADALVPRELDPILPPGVRFAATSLRLFAGPQARQGRPGERLARSLERLGPVAIKLGQVLSTRADMFGRPFADDLARLKDQLAPFPTDQALAEATPQDRLKQPSNQVALPEAAVPVLRERGMIGHIAIEPEAAEPAVRQIEVNLLA